MTLTFIFFFSAYSYSADRCQEYQSDCEYYHCIAEAKHCDETSYAIRFGHHYCMRYQSLAPSFTEAGKEWIQKVRECLILKMDEIEDTLSCGQMKTVALNHHLPCYVENGFCELSFSDKTQVLRTVWQSLRNPFILAGSFRILKSCQ